MKKYEKSLKSIAIILLIAVLTMIYSETIQPVFAANSTYRSQYRPIEDGYYMIQSGTSSNLVLDVHDFGFNNGANVEVYHKTYGTNQIFHVVHQTNGYYSIQMIHSGKVLDVAGGSRSSNVNCQQYQWNQSAAQLWYFENAGNGYYYIRSKLGTYLDNANNSSRDGNNVLLYSLNKGNNQKWKFIKTSKPAMSCSVKLSNSVSTLPYNGSYKTSISISANYPITKFVVGIYSMSGDTIKETSTNLKSRAANGTLSFKASEIGSGRRILKITARNGWGDTVVAYTRTFDVAYKPSLTVSPKSISITRGSQKKLTAYAIELNSSKIKWTTSNSSIAYLINANGGTVTVVGKKPGTAKITATIWVGLKKYTSTCTVTVKSYF